MMVGHIPPNNFSNYAKSLINNFTNERTLFVISSDFCHWGKRFQYTHKYDEFDDSEIYKSIFQLDNEGIEHIE